MIFLSRWFSVPRDEGRVLKFFSWDTGFLRNFVTVVVWHVRLSLGKWTSHFSLHEPTSEKCAARATLPLSASNATPPRSALAQTNLSWLRLLTRALVNAGLGRHNVLILNRESGRKNSSEITVDLKVKIYDLHVLVIGGRCSTSSELRIWYFRDGKW